jgi:hypothetical protein
MLLRCHRRQLHQVFEACCVLFVVSHYRVPSKARAGSERCRPAK